MWELYHCWRLLEDDVRNHEGLQTPAGNTACFYDHLSTPSVDTVPCQHKVILEDTSATTKACVYQQAAAPSLFVRV